MRHFLDIDELSEKELLLVLDRAERAAPSLLSEHAVALIFEKPSTRTRASMEAAVGQLGGRPITFGAGELGLDVRESVEDVTRVLAQYCSAIAARVFEQSVLERMTAVSHVPVINLLSNESHPCQALADLLTLRQLLGGLEDRTLTWIGDGNNVCISLMKATALAGMKMRIASPAGYEVPPEVAVRTGAYMTQDPDEAVTGAHAVYTDTWISMGWEDETERRRGDFAGFMVDEELMERARPGAIFLHCLPAHRGAEVSAEVIDGPRSAVWRQAANRLHTQRALLWWLLENASPASSQIE